MQSTPDWYDPLALEADDSDFPDPWALELERLIRRGRETPDVDLKGPGSWQSWDARAKAELVRDMMAMGNGDRPGWLILGVSRGSAGEAVYEGLDEPAAKSFDPTPIGQKVREYSDPEVEFDVLRANVDGRLYVAIRVAPFSSVPHICRRSYGNVLEEGAIYVRTEACQTAKISRAEQTRKILDRAIQIHADSIVSRIERLFRSSERGETKVEVDESDKQLLEEQLKQVRGRAGEK